MTGIRPTGFRRTRTTEINPPVVLTAVVAVMSHPDVDENRQGGSRSKTRQLSMEAKNLTWTLSQNVYRPKRTRATSADPGTLAANFDSSQRPV